MIEPSTSRSSDLTGRLRQLLLLVLIVGTLGLLLELLLLEHWDSPWQWTPLTLLAIMLVLSFALLARASGARVRAFRAAGALCVAAGMLGVGLHLRSNVQLERELNPAIGGGRLLWDSVRGGTPLLAPGALLQLGLLGLLFAYRHPALRHETGDGATTSPPPA